MKMTGIIGAIVGISLLISSISLDAMTSKTGVTSANFLKLGVGPRAAAMGEAFSAVADDVTAIYWNPAGLAQLEQDELATMYKEWFVNINSGSLAYAHPSNTKKYTQAFAINYVDAGEIHQTTKDGQTNAIFRPEDFAISFSRAKYIRKNLAVGSTVKYIHQRLYNENANGFAVDSGILYRISNTFYLSGVIQNLGTKMKFVDQGFELPLTFKTGLAYRLKTLIFTADYNKPTDNEPSINFGFESNVGKTISLRLGYRYEKGDNKLDLYKSSPSGVTGGLGLNLGDIYYLDYGFASYGDLGDTNRVAFLMKMGLPEILPEPVLPLPKTKEIEPKESAPPAKTVPLKKKVKTEKTVPTQPKPSEVKPSIVTPETKEVAPAPTIPEPEVVPEVKIEPKVPEKEISAPLPKEKPLHEIAPPPAVLPPTESQIKKFKISPLVKPKLKLEKEIEAKPLPKVLPEEKISTKREITVLEDNTTIWSGPGATYEEIAIVNKGEKLGLLDDSNHFYFKVLLPDGKVGWICYVFVSK